MTIKKYLHSCILLEKDGKRLLIDPGAFSFIEEKIKPENIGPVDIILLTHEHLDHYSPDAIRKISSQKTPVFITHDSLAELMKKDGFEAQIIKSGETITEGPFTIKGLEAPHEIIPAPTPENLGYIINDNFLHPGDSLSFTPPNIHTFALPVAAPWQTTQDGLNSALKVKPQQVIPIHDAIIKDFMLTRIYAMLEKKLSEANITFTPLDLTNSAEIPD